MSEPAALDLKSRKERMTHAPAALDWHVILAPSRVSLTAIRHVQTNRELMLPDYAVDSAPGPKIGSGFAAASSCRSRCFMCEA